MRSFLKKNLGILVLCFFIYSLYFVFNHQNLNNHSVQVLGTENNLTLFEQPMDGRSPIIDSINNAQKEIDLEMYLLSDKEIISALEAAHDRGIIVHVLLEQHPFGAGNINEKAKSELTADGIPVNWTNPSFALTHEKAIVIDNNEVWIMNQNLTAASFKSNREYDIMDDNPTDAQTIDQIFNADAQRQSLNIADSNLVVSPDNSRDKLVTLLNSAAKTIDIETEVIDDKQIINLLTQKAKSTQIKVILAGFSKVSTNKYAADQLKNAGIEVETVSSPYIHAKLIDIDNTKAYIGSVNLTTQSMDQNREMGIIISQADILQSLNSDFDSDWSLGQVVN